LQSTCIFGTVVAVGRPCEMALNHNSRIESWNGSWFAEL
jgi:hypothetical protein